MNREPVMIVTLIVIALKWGLSFLGITFGPEDQALLENAVSSLVLLTMGLVERSQVTPVAKAEGIVNNRLKTPVVATDEAKREIIDALRDGRR